MKSKTCLGCLRKTKNTTGLEICVSPELIKSIHPETPSNLSYEPLFYAAWKCTSPDDGTRRFFVPETLTPSLN